MVSLSLSLSLFVFQFHPLFPIPLCLSLPSSLSYPSFSFTSILPLPFPLFHACVHPTHTSIHHLPRTCIPSPTLLSPHPSSIHSLPHKTRLFCLIAWVAIFLSLSFLMQSLTIFSFLLFSSFSSLSSHSHTLSLSLTHTHTHTHTQTLFLSHKLSFSLCLSPSLSSQPAEDGSQALYHGVGADTR